MSKCWINIVASFSALFHLLCVLYLFLNIFCTHIVNTCKYYHWKTIILRVILGFLVVQVTGCVIYT